MTSWVSIQRALISVSDKTNLLPFCEALSRRGIEILSTGGTAAYLQAADISVTLVEDYTGFPEMMSGRIKTLHPKVHGGLLGRRDEDHAVMQAHEILPIDLAIINLYPFAQTPGIEQIDIGGPAMIRSAAKNHAFVTVLVDHQDYESFIHHLDQHDGKIDLDHRLHYAAKAFALTAQYDAMIAAYLHQQDKRAVLFPQKMTLALEKISDLSYGENPQQQAALYQTYPHSKGVAQFKQQQGKKLSFNNVADADLAWQCVQQFQMPACVIVKHSNPCGVALGKDSIDAYQRAFAADPTSAFGGIIAFNQALTAELAQIILNTQFVELIMVPHADPGAMITLQQKPNVRLLLCDCAPVKKETFDIKRIEGGFLIQTLDDQPMMPEAWTCVTGRSATEAEWIDLKFAWQVVKYVKSNAIIYAKALQTIGIGVGQTSRVASGDFGWQKAQQAGLAQACVMASDAFFPFRDGIDVAAQAGVTAIIQPGGSIRDEEIIRAANEHGMAMIFTHVRHFRH